MPLRPDELDEVVAIVRAEIAAAAIKKVVLIPKSMDVELEVTPELKKTLTPKPVVAKAKAEAPSKKGK
jgi:hypothetical protein